MKRTVYAIAFVIITVTFQVIAKNVSSSGTPKTREVGSLVFDNIPEIPDRIITRMLQYRNARSAHFLDWDPRGSGMLITTRFGDVNQLHSVTRPSGMRRQITFFSEPVFFGTFCPDTSKHGFLFTKDIGGNEQYQIFYYNLDNGVYTMLTDSAAKYGAVVWSRKGDRFAFFSTKRNGKDWDVYSGWTEHETICQSGGNLLSHL